MNNQDLEKKIKEIVHSATYEKGFVSSIDVLISLEYLKQKDYDAWRLGKVDYLEKLCKTNLSKLSTINKIIRKTASGLQLEKSLTDYRKHGKGVKIKLRFSKSGTANIEENYATHYVDKKRINELKIKLPGDKQEKSNTI